MREQTQAKLEYKILYSLVVAGKSAAFAEQAMKKFLGEYTDCPLWHVGYLAKNKRLLDAIKEARMGNYGKLSFAFADIERRVREGQLNLATCTPQDLEYTRGIGPKTSRFFILWTRENARFAALDTHILKWLKYLGYDAPKSTPTGKKYAELEAVFLAEADKRKTPPGKLDESIWRWCQYVHMNNPKADWSLPETWHTDLRNGKNK